MEEESMKDPTVSFYRWLGWSVLTVSHTGGWVVFSLPVSKLFFFLALLNEPICETLEGETESNSQREIKNPTQTLHTSEGN